MQFLVSRVQFGRLCLLVTSRFATACWGCMRYLHATAHCILCHEVPAGKGTLRLRGRLLRVSLNWQQSARGCPHNWLVILGSPRCYLTNERRASRKQMRLLGRDSEYSVRLPNSGPLLCRSCPSPFRGLKSTSQPSLLEPPNGPNCLKFVGEMLQEEPRTTSRSGSRDFSGASHSRPRFLYYRSKRPKYFERCTSYRSPISVSLRGVPLA